MADDLSFQAFIEDIVKDFEQTQRELKEIDIQINQNAADVERLAQRHVQMLNHIRQLQVNFETLPREDIKEGYDALVDAQQRLLTMRGQLEKLQSVQRNLERLLDLQRRLIEFSGGSVQMLDDESNQKGSALGGESPNIIRLIQTEEAVRQSLVRRMHDGAASSLSNFILQAEICQRFFDVNPDRARQELNALKSSAASTFSDVKDFIFDLRPMMLDDLGVVPTLRRYVDSVQEKNGITLPITVTGIERRLESHIEVTIFRSVQELLNNAISHAQATQIQVALDLAQEEVTAIVEDNGRGFNPDEALSGNGRTIGLSTLRERIQMLGGDLNIQSSVGQGSRIEFSIPIQNEQQLIT